MSTIIGSWKAFGIAILMFLAAWGGAIIVDRVVRAAAWADVAERTLPMMVVLFFAASFSRTVWLAERLDNVEKRLQAEEEPETHQLAHCKSWPVLSYRQVPLPEISSKSPHAVVHSVTQKGRCVMSWEDASRQYGDLYGTAAIDGHDGPPLREIAQACGVDTEKWFPVGMRLSGAELEIEIEILAVPQVEGGVDEIGKQAKRDGKLIVTRISTGKTLGQLDLAEYVKALDISLISRYVRHEVGDAVEIEYVYQEHAQEDL